MGTIYTYEHPGEDGGTWYAASYPLGATRYYSSETARADAVDAYKRAITGTGGSVYIIDADSRMREVSAALRR